MTEKFHGYPCEFTITGEHISPRRARRPGGKRHIPSLTWIQIAARLSDYGLIPTAWLAALCKGKLFSFIAEPFVDDSGEVAEAGGDSGFRVPGVNESSSLAFADQCARALEAFKLSLDGIHVIHLTEDVT